MFLSEYQMDRIGFIAITNWESFFYCKSGQRLLQIGAELLQVGTDLLQIGAVITYRRKYYKSVHNKHHVLLREYIKICIK